MTVATGQLSLLARPEVVFEYRPWEWLCSRSEAVPSRGGSALTSATEESPSVDQLTTQGQVVMAARTLETERLAAFLRDHAAEAMLVTEAE